MNISVIIPICYESVNTVERCIKSIRSLEAGDSIEIIVVDNNAVVSPSEPLCSHVDQWISLPKNLGYARGCNAGAAKANREKLLLLNPDTRVREDALLILNQYMEEHPECGLAAPELTYPDGGRVLSILGDPTPWDFFCMIYPIQSFVPDMKLFEKYRWAYSWKTISQPVSVDWVGGAAMFVRRQEYRRLGGMSPAYGLYMEEVDLCLRYRKELQREIHYVPEANIVHEGGAGSQNLGQFPVFNSLRSRMIFSKRHFSTLNHLLASFVLLPAVLISFYRRLYQREVDSRGHPHEGTIRDFLCLLMVVITQCLAPVLPFPRSF